MIEIKNKDLQFFLETFLNKPIKDFTNEDLDKFNMLVYDVNPKENNRVVIMDDISLFKNVKRVIVTSGLVSNKNIQLLKDKNVSSLLFKRCAFEDDKALSSLTDLKSLELIGSYNEDYTFLNNMNNLEFLAIVNPYTETPIDITSLDGKSNLNEFILQRCILDNFSSLSKCSNVEYLNVLWSVITEEVVPIVNKMKNLKELFISEGRNLDGINGDIIVKHDLNEFLFDEEIDSNDNTIKK